MNNDFENMYIQAIKLILDEKGLETANRVNHAALNVNLIDVKLFLVAANILANEILKR